MTKVILYGSIAKAMGRSVWCLELERPADLFRAIEVNTGKMFNYLKEYGHAYFRFVINGSDVRSKEEFVYTKIELETIEVVPALAGAGSSGIWLLLAGLALIAVAIFVPVFGPSLGTAWSSAAVTASMGQTLLFTVGLYLALSGVAQLVNPIVDNSREQPENRPSYIYDGPVNTLRQGNPVPLGFGFVGVGSQVISAGIRSADVMEADIMETE